MKKFTKKHNVFIDKCFSKGVVGKRNKSIRQNHWKVIILTLWKILCQLEKLIFLGERCDEFLVVLRNGWKLYKKKSTNPKDNLNKKTPKQMSSSQYGAPDRYEPLS